MDVSVDILRTVDLNYPVDGGEVDSTRTDISAEEHCIFLFNELEIYCCTLVLLHFSMKFKQVLAHL